MKNIILVILGFILFIIALIFPIPTILTVPGGVWRTIIGLFSCFSIYKGVRKR